MTKDSDPANKYSRLKWQTIFYFCFPRFIFILVLLLMEITLSFPILSPCFYTFFQTGLNVHYFSNNSTGVNYSLQIVI